jgi:hypothetical protein
MIALYNAVHGCITARVWKDITERKVKVLRKFAHFSHISHTRAEIETKIGGEKQRGRACSHD